MYVAASPPHWPYSGAPVAAVFTLELVLVEVGVVDVDAFFEEEEAVTTTAVVEAFLVVLRRFFGLTATVTIMIMVHDHSPVASHRILLPCPYGAVVY